MFELGEANSSNKMNASKMREQLMLKYPNKFLLPGEIEIKKLDFLLRNKKDFIQRNFNNFLPLY